jgi:integrase
MTDLNYRCREAWIAEGLSEKTIHAYLLVLERSERWLRAHGTSVLEAKPSEIRELADAWPRTRSSRVQLRTALGRAWQVAERRQAPLSAVLVPTKPRYVCRALSEPQASALARRARAAGGVEGLAVLLALYAGLRRSEIASLRWADIDLEVGWLRIVGKGDVTAELPIHHELAQALVDVGRQGPFVFPGSRGRAHVTPATVWGWSRRLSAEAIGLEVSTHRLRHTAIATLNDRTGDLRTAQAFARHASPETTVLYTRVPRARLEAAVATLDYCSNDN